MAEPVVGDLLPEPYQPKPKQPGGPGTPVTDPTQTVGEHVGMFMPGCSHSINSYNIQQTTIDGIQQILACCPMCGWVQRILPATTFDADPFTFIAILFF